MLAIHICDETRTSLLITQSVMFYLSKANALLIWSWIFCSTDDRLVLMIIDWNLDRQVGILQTQETWRSIHNIDTYEWHHADTVSSAPTSRNRQRLPFATTISTSGLLRLITDLPCRTGRASFPNSSYLWASGVSVSCRYTLNISWTSSKSPRICRNVGLLTTVTVTTKTLLLRPKNVSNSRSPQRSCRNGTTRHSRSRSLFPQMSSARMLGSWWTDVP